MKISHIEMKNITVTDRFWKYYMDLVRKNVIPYQWNALNDRIPDATPSHCLRNFRIASGRETGAFSGFVFQDSDVYKWLEAVSFSLLWYPDKELEKLADDTIDLIASAQQPDGYLDTYYIINGLSGRFTNLRDNHELYCLGHMIEAAVAYYRATGKKKFLTVAVKYTDCVDRTLGTEPGKKRGYPGHEVLEMALMKLYDATGAERYLKLAEYFINERGQSPLYFEQEGKNNGTDFYWKDSYFKYQYYQAGKPVRMQNKAEGHAVRAVYLYSGMADVARTTGDRELLDTCIRLWNNITERQMYVTGSIGAQHYGESFSFDYNLPNDEIYGETCAAVGLVFFARRMFEATGESRYIDVMERVLYNGALSGIALDGESFFYVNPLEVEPEAFEKLHTLSESEYVRQKWFGCSCCPPNIARLLSSVSEYAFAKTESELFINLFMGAEIRAEFQNVPLTIKVDSGLPWNGDVCVSIHSPAPAFFSLAVRIPEWSSGAVLKVNGQNIELKMANGYAVLSRVWNDGDTVSIMLHMATELCSANPKVREDIGKTAVVRGPVVYCLEETDNGKNLHTLFLKHDPEFKEQIDGNLLNGIMTICADGERITENNWNPSELYRTDADEHDEDCTLRFIPYYAWANRTPGEMLVWVHRR